MAGDTTQTFAPAMKFNYGGGVIDAVRKGRAAKRGQAPSPRSDTSPTRPPQQNTDRVRDALRLKPWL